MTPYEPKKLRGVGKPKREWTPGPVIIMKPVHSIGRFYDKLNSVAKKQAQGLHRQAPRMASVKIQSEYYRLERMSRVSNFDTIQPGTMM